MALTQAQWYEKVKGFVPGWMWETQEGVAEAWAQALAKGCADLQANADAHVTSTFITEATGDTLDAHAGERRITRLSGELDPSLQTRTQNLFNQSNVPALRSFINQVLVAGNARIQEDFNSTPFLDREYFSNRAAVFLDVPFHNTFSVVVDRQVHDAFAFAGREYFLDREAFTSTSESLESVFEVILRIVNDNKALGTFYRILELLE